MIFESHAHYESEKYDEDRDQLLSSMKENGIEYVVNVGSSIHTSAQSIQLAEQYEHVYAAIGVHPSDVPELDEDKFNWLKSQTEHKKVVAVGEIGLDYYWEKDEAKREEQKYWFRRQMELAREVDLPVIIHSREAAADTMQLMKEMHAEEIPGVVHCYSYSEELAEEFLKMGYYIGIGGVLTFKNSKKLKEVAKMLPMDRILLETDCPYLTPEPHRGQRNSSLNIPYIVAELSRIKGISEEEIIAVTRENAKRMYRIE